MTQVKQGENRLDRVEKMLEEQAKRSEALFVLMEEQAKRNQEMDKRFAEMREEMDKRFAEMSGAILTLAGLHEREPSSHRVAAD